MQSSVRALLGPLVGFLVLSAIFALLERLWPAIRGQRRWRAGAGTDLVYWIVTPLVFKPLGRALTVAPLVLLAIVMTRGMPVKGDAVRAWIEAGHGPIARLPAAPQAALALIVADFVGYWAHRLFHGRSLWRFHAVHHSPVEMDWLASVRVHPVNEIANTALHAVVLVALGFRPAVLAPVLPVFTFYAILLHANVSWTFGPLRYVIASPTFHRWHHTAQEEGLDKNFAGLLPLWDLMFGTFYMPKDRLPVRFGVIGDRVPDGFFRQLVWPFQRRR